MPDFKVCNFYEQNTAKTDAAPRFINKSLKQLQNIPGTETDGHLTLSLLAVNFEDH